MQTIQDSSCHPQGRWRSGLKGLECVISDFFFVAFQAEVSAGSAMPPTTWLKPPST
jgi:hypothetical protein